jgi:cystathionine beta-lyase/cystathionine gamma-synthase
MNQQQDITDILHHMGEHDLPFNAVSPPIFQTSIFCFKSFDAFKEALEDEANHFIYTRGNNPTVNLVEEKIAALEHAERAKLVASGAAAISASVTAFVKKGDHVLAVQDCYSWAKSLLVNYLSRFGVESSFVDGCDPAEFEAAIRPNTKVIYLESPTTFTFKLQNLKAVAAIAKKHGIKTIIDNTWCTPIYQNPIDLGIDIVLHSATKYLGGNSDAVAGVIAGKEADIRHIFETEFMTMGAVPDPFMAWLILRGMRTLHIRLPVHFESAKKITAFLAAHPLVESVLYPFTPDYPQRELAETQMRGGSGLFSFRLKTRDVNKVRTFVDTLTLFKRAVSWGGYESLISPSAVGNFPDGIIPDDKVSLIRLHIGLESVESLVEDLTRALDAIR